MLLAVSNQYPTLDVPNNILEYPYHALCNKNRAKFFQETCSHPTL